MKIYFEDGPLRDEIEIPGEILLARVDAINGVSANREDLDLLHSYSKEHSVSIYTNSIFAFSNKYAWNDELKIPEIYIRHGHNNEFTCIDKLTNRSLRQAHNLASMYIAGEFSGTILHLWCVGSSKYACTLTEKLTELSGTPYCIYMSDYTIKNGISSIMADGKVVGGIDFDEDHVIVDIAVDDESLNETLKEYIGQKVEW